MWQCRWRGRQPAPPTWWQQSPVYLSSIQSILYNNKTIPALANLHGISLALGRSLGGWAALQAECPSLAGQPLPDCAAPGIRDQFTRIAPAFLAYLGTVQPAIAQQTAVSSVHLS